VVVTLRCERSEPRRVSWSAWPILRDAASRLLRMTIVSVEASERTA